MNILIPAYLPWILIGIEAAAILFCLLYLLLPLRRIKRLPIIYAPGELPQPIEESHHQEEENQIQVEEIHAQEEEIPEAAPTITSLPKVSVVIYSTVDEERLTLALEAVCAQDYPDFEVIVVCDATFETSEMLAEKYAAMFGNVYVTFIPPGSHNLSRRKLALTLGTKAANGEVIVTTVANADFGSSSWLRELVEPFRCADTEITLGYSRMDYTEMKGGAKWYREFNTLLTDARWIGYALSGHPYRGDGFNLAFRREVFFRCKGYSKSMHLHSGDDDLFVSEIARRHNTGIVITPSSIVTTEWGNSSARVWNLRKSQYDFTARWLPQGPFMRAGAASFSQWLVLLVAVAASVVTLPAFIHAIVAGVLWLVFLSFEIAIYRRAASRLQATRLWWAVPLFWLYKPLGNAFFRLAHNSTRFKNYTWQRR